MYGKFFFRPSGGESGEYMLGVGKCATLCSGMQSSLPYEYCKSSAMLPYL